MLKFKSIFLVVVFLLTIFEVKAFNVFVKGSSGYQLKYPQLENTSFNDVAEKLGFKPNFYSLYMGAGDAKQHDIYGVLFKVFSSDIICVLTENHVKELCQRDIDVFLKEYNYENEFNISNIESHLTRGIEDKDYTLPFVAQALKINCDTTIENGIIISDKFKYNLYFLNGILIKFDSSDGYNKWAKEMKQVNPEYFVKMHSYASEYWKDDEKSVIKEINAQCDAWASCPDGFRNEYLDKFLDGGVYNFKMLNVLYGNDSVSLRELNDFYHGNVKFYKETTTKDEEGNDMKIYIYYSLNGIFAFDESERLYYSQPY